MKASISIVIVTLICLLLLPSFATANTATIEKVIQAARLQIKGWEVVRITGIIAQKLEEPMGKEAYEFAKEEIEGKLVVMHTYTTDNTAAGIVRDGEGLCMVQIEYTETTLSDGEKKQVEEKVMDFGARLLENGYARIDEKYLPEWLQYYREIERKAKVNHIGIWAQ